MSNQKNILFFYSHLSTFVKKDLEILASEYTVVEHDFPLQNKLYTPISFLSQLLFIFKHIGKADLLIVQFAGYHSFLPALCAKLTRKPCLIISGGTDAHYFPGIRYGNWQKKFLKTFTALSFQLCSHISPKHKTLMSCDYTYDTSEPRLQGIYARLPNLKTPYTEITNGYDTAKWHCTELKKKNTFITVCGAWEYSFQQQLKGIDLILELASSFPTCEFIILGVDKTSRIAKKPENVTVIGAVKNEALISIFSSCEFYFQLSIAEGFPNSLCEAMLCECIPMGSNVFSIPEIIGDSGFVLETRNVKNLVELVTKAMVADKDLLRKKARMRISENYTLQMRSKNLLDLCSKLDN